MSGAMDPQRIIDESARTQERIEMDRERYGEPDAAFNRPAPIQPGMCPGCGEEETDGSLCLCCEDEAFDDMDD